MRHVKLAETRRSKFVSSDLPRAEDCRDIADKQAEVEDEEDAPAPKASKAKADKSKKPAAKDEAAPADDGMCSNCRFRPSTDKLDPNSSDPECVKVKDWRHKLQRAFLGKAPPTADVSLSTPS